MALTRRKISSSEFEAVYKDENIQKVLHARLNNFAHLIPPEDLKNCGVDAVWRCLSYHQDGRGNKFTTSLWRFINWECCRQIKKLNKQNRLKTISFSVIETKSKLDIPVDNGETLFLLKDAMNALPQSQRDILHLRYFERKTLQEIGDSNGYSKETAQLHIERAIKELRKLYGVGV